MMGTSIDSKFIETSEAIVSQLGFKDLKSFVKRQALFMLLAKIEKFEVEDKFLESKYHMTFEDFCKRIEAVKNEEDFTEEEDYLDWRFTKEALVRLMNQKLELEYA